MLSYFFIVLIGVIVSRLFKNYTEPQPRQRGLQTTDYLWIAFSAVIALIIFANFQQQVHLTRNIITNISLAFGFGFGFDKVLEAGQRLGGSGIIVDIERDSSNNSIITIYRNKTKPNTFLHPANGNYYEIRVQQKHLQNHTYVFRHQTPYNNEVTSVTSEPSIAMQNSARRHGGYGGE